MRGSPKNKWRMGGVPVAQVGLTEAEAGVGLMETCVTTNSTADRGGMETVKSSLR